MIKEIVLLCSLKNMLVNRCNCDKFLFDIFDKKINEKNNN